MSSAEIISEYVKKFNLRQSKIGLGGIDLSLYHLVHVAPALVAWAEDIARLADEFTLVAARAIMDNSTHEEMLSEVSRLSYVRRYVKLTNFISESLLQRGIESRYEWLDSLKQELTESIQWIGTCHPGRNQLVSHFRRMVFDLSMSLNAKAS